MTRKKENAWDRVLAYVSERLNVDSFETWFGSTSLIEERDDIIRVSAPNETISSWLQSNYADLVAEALSAIGRSNSCSVEYVSQQQAGDGAAARGNIWARVLARLEVSIRRRDFAQWLQRTALACDDGETLEIRVESTDVGKWITKHYLPAIKEALAACGRSGAKVVFLPGPPVTGTVPSKKKGPQGKSLNFEEIEPWDEFVDGAALLSEMACAVERFVTLPPHASSAIALWIMHTYTHEAAFFSPVIAITSPIKGCGKTSLLIVIGSLVSRRQFASNLTSAVLFRLVDKFQPTLLIDEADTFLPENDQLRGLLNSGYTKATAWLVRNIGEDYEPRQFCTWCPKVIAAIGQLPGTLEDRSIQIRMRRQRKGDDGYRQERLRQDKIDGWHLPVRRRAARWAYDHVESLVQRDPSVPDTLQDRAADCWRPLLAIADESGGEWPERARRAAEALSGAAFTQHEHEPGVELLRDLVELMTDAAEDIPSVLRADPNGIVSSQHMIDALASLPDRPWGTWRGDRPITPRGLAVLLAPLGVTPDRARVLGGGDQALVRGYRMEAIQDACARYLPVQAVHVDQSLKTKDLREKTHVVQTGPVPHVKTGLSRLVTTVDPHVPHVQTKTDVIPMIAALERSINQHHRPIKASGIANTRRIADGQAKRTAR